MLARLTLSDVLDKLCRWQQRLQWEHQEIWRKRREQVKMSQERSLKCNNDHIKIVDTNQNEFALSLDTKIKQGVLCIVFCMVSTCLQPCWEIYVARSFSELSPPFGSFLCRVQGCNWNGNHEWQAKWSQSFLSFRVTWKTSASLVATIPLLLYCLT